MSDNEYLDTEEKLLPIIKKILDNFEGDAGELENAIGMMFLGTRLGWKPLLLMHSRTTIKKYEKLLGIEIRKVFPEEGRQPTRSVAYKYLRQATDFWKAVRGELPDVRSKLLARR